MAATVVSGNVTEELGYFSRKPAPLFQVTHHRLISTEFDALRFDAAASLQLVPILTPGTTPLPLDTKVITSPYNDSQHLIDLDGLSLQDRILTLALTTLKPIRDDYPSLAYEDIFNWEAVLATIRGLSGLAEHTWTKQDYYVVIFRSLLKEGCDQELLYDLDKHSHREACESGGLLKYWFGKLNSSRQNLATCIWRNREDARLGGRGPWHAKARAAGRTLYDEIVFSTWRLTVEDGATSWTIKSWD